MWATRASCPPHNHGPIPEGLDRCRRIFILCSGRCGWHPRLLFLRRCPCVILYVAVIIVLKVV